MFEGKLIEITCTVPVCCYYFKFLEGSRQQVGLLTGSVYYMRKVLQWFPPGRKAFKMMKHFIARPLRKDFVKAAQGFRTSLGFVLQMQD